MNHTINLQSIVFIWLKIRSKYSNCRFWLPSIVLPLNLSRERSSARKAVYAMAIGFSGAILYSLENQSGGISPGSGKLAKGYELMLI